MFINLCKHKLLKNYFGKQFNRIERKITSKQFKDNLQGVFGYIDEKIFEKYKNLFLRLKND